MADPEMCQSSLSLVMLAAKAMGQFLLAQVTVFWQPAQTIYFACKLLQVIPEAKTPSHPAQKTSGIPMFSSKRHMPGKKSSPQSSAAASPKVSKHGTPARPLKSDLDHSGKSSRTPPVEVEKELTSSGQVRVLYVCT